MKAIADGELWIWGCNSGNPGSMNDINILIGSSNYQDILEEKMIPKFKYVVSGNQCDLLYNLVDGIYRQWAIFIDTIAMTGTRKKRCLSGLQKVVRKDLELAYGVLVSR